MDSSFALVPCKDAAGNRLRFANLFRSRAEDPHSKRPSGMLLQSGPGLIFGAIF